VVPPFLFRRDSPKTTRLIMPYKFIFCFVFLPLILSAQPAEYLRVKEHLSFTDEVKILSVFVETPDGNWEDEEIAYTLNEYAAAKEWLISEANYYGQSIIFDDDAFSRDNGSVVFMDRTPQAGNSPKKTINTVLQKLNYRDFEGFLHYNQVSMQEDKIKVLLFVKSNNRSHAYSNFAIKDVDLAVVYCRHRIGSLTDRYVIAHEALHLFGAWDLYLGRSQTDLSAREAKERWPHSVMVGTQFNKDKIVVDELTAWRIGWGEFDREYTAFSPAVNREILKKEIRIDPRKTVIKIRPRKKGPKKDKDTGGE